MRKGALRSCTHGTSSCPKVVSTRIRRGYHRRRDTTHESETTRLMDPQYPSGRPAADRAELTSPGTGQPPPSFSFSPRVCGYRTRITPTRHATPRHATPCYAAISWKPGRFLGTPDLVNKTPLHVLARLTSPPSRSMVSETLVIVNVDVRCIVHSLGELTIVDSV